MDGKQKMIVSDPLIVLVLCIAGTFFWRAMGVAIANRIDISSDIFQWFNCVAYAMLAGLITRVILIPSGMLAQTPDFDRIAAISAGLVMFFLFKRSIFAGTGIAFTTFLALTTARNFGLI